MDELESPGSESRRFKARSIPSERAIDFPRPEQKPLKRKKAPVKPQPALKTI